MDTLGKRLAHRRDVELDWSQDALGKLVGMKQQGIFSIETGAVARPRKLREIARAIGVSEDWLLDGTAPKELIGDVWIEIAGPLPNRLRLARIFADLSIQDIAQTLGVSRPDYVSWEWGKSTPSQRILEAIATETGTSFTWLSTEAEDMVQVHKLASTIGTRLRFRRASLGFSRSDLAEMTDISSEIIEAIENAHDSHVPENVIPVIADTLKVSVAWLAHGKGSAPQPSLSNRNLPTTGVVQFPASLPHAVISSPEGARPEGEVLELDARRPVREQQGGEDAVSSWERSKNSDVDPIKHIEKALQNGKSFALTSYLRELNLLPESVVMVEVITDAMSPSYNPGDRVIVDITQTRPDSGVYVIDMENGPRLRRLQLIEGTSPPQVVVKYDNPSFDTQRVPLDSLFIIGMVRARISKA